MGVVANLSLSGSGRKVGWGGRLFEAGRLLTLTAFRMGANSRLGAYSNKYGMRTPLISDHLSKTPQNFLSQSLTVGTSHRQRSPPVSDRDHF